MKRLIPIATSTRCLVCKGGTERRTQVDRLLELHLSEQADSTGVPLTWERLEQLVPLVLGVPSITMTSLKRHRQAHCRIVEDGDGLTLSASGVALGADMEALIEDVERLLDSTSPSPTGVLGVQLRAYLLQLRQALERGEKVPMTHDQAARAANALMVAEKRGQEAELMQTMSAALSSVFTRQLSEPEPEVVDAVVVREVEAGEDG